jgi:protein O-mannosyl-transferase
MARARAKSRPLPAARATVRRDWVPLLLLVGTIAVYVQTAHFGFVNYDDPDYTTGNPHVRAGLTLAGVAWAFTHSFAGNWFPLTWISHMLDVSLFGLDAGRHHLMSVVIHASAAVLLYLALRRLTLPQWPSAMVAALFALHPLHVESVAWIAERKDVLSALFCMLTLWAYARYAERATTGRYALALAAFALGLMSKQMLVTLPLVLMVLDYWPLQRGLKVREKLPFLALAAAAAIAAVLSHNEAGARASLDIFPLGLRIQNALVTCVVYLLKMVWPSGLAVFYPYATSLLLPAIGSAILLAAITWSALRRPYLLAGWTWYLITLAPVIGIVQVGAQARADRYTYLPMIGVSIAAVWGVAELLRTQPRVLAAIGMAVCVACAMLTYIQVGYWQDGVTLFRHTIEVTRDNYVAHFNLAAALEERGENAEAAAHLNEAVRIRPRFAVARAELAARGNSEVAGTKHVTSEMF